MKLFQMNSCPARNWMGWRNREKKLSDIALFRRVLWASNVARERVFDYRVAWPELVRKRWPVLLKGLMILWNFQYTRFPLFTWMHVRLCLARIDAAAVVVVVIAVVAFCTKHARRHMNTDASAQPKYTQKPRNNKKGKPFQAKWQPAQESNGVKAYRKWEKKGMLENESYILSFLNGPVSFGYSLCFRFDFNLFSMYITCLTKHFLKRFCLSFE